MQISAVDLFGCKVLVCESCCGLVIHPFYFQDPKEVKPTSIIIGHTCPEYSYTRLQWISDEKLADHSGLTLTLVNLS